MAGHRNESHTPQGNGSVRRPAVALARGLDWFSIGLGLAEASVPGVITAWLGMRGQEGIVRTYGVREIANGIGILRAKDPTPWIWGRVAGDVLDLSTVAPHLKGAHPAKDNVVRALASLAGVTIVDVVCGVRLGTASG
ncbi:MAG: hypothetical protein JOY92_10345 [Verrucomicrobia bacterium]|nr:hypothetical protein [Verrucomicrobiota bacterium]